MKHAAVALGSSLGASRRCLALATAMLGSTPSVTLLSTSRIFLTPPDGGVARRPVLNAAVHLQTTLPPQVLLERCRFIEQRLGRKITRRWADRTIDLDLLLYEGVQLDTPELVLPHPRMHDRPFQLLPLLDCWPDVPGPWRAAAAHMRKLPIVGVLRR